MNKIYIFILIITFGILVFFLYNKFAYLNIIVKFDELEPFERQMNVYYKGFKVGKTVKIYPDKDYKNTYLKLKLSPSNINLPNNITAKINKLKTKEYISIIYPESPSIKKIKNDDIIKGNISKDLNSLLNESVGKDEIDEIVEETSSLIGSANNTIQNLNDIFIEIKEIVVNSKKDIKIATNNLAKTTINLEQATKKLNNSINSEEISTSINNLEETTKNISEVTEQINKTTLPLANSIICDGKEITNGIKNTLKQRMGILKIMFGKPIKNNCN